MARRKDKRTRAAHIRDFLTGSPAAVRCLESQRLEEALLTRVRDLLTPAARPHCIHAQAAEGRLTVTVDTAAWATRLRYLAPELAQGLADAAITRVKIQARPRVRQPDRPTASHLARLSPAVVDHLLAAADYTAEAGIAEVFRRLAGRQRNTGPGEPSI